MGRPDTEVVSGCSFCSRPAAQVGGLATGEDGVAICSECAVSALHQLDVIARKNLASQSHGIGHIYREHFQDPRRERHFVASVSFFLTFAAVRFIVRSIQKGKGPFRNISPGGRHIHHLVWGILLLLAVGLAWLQQVGTGVIPPRKWTRLTAGVYGTASALTLDEFALWLNLSDVYFTPEGRESIDAVFLFGSLLSIGFWGSPFLHALTKHLIRQAGQVGGS